MAGQPLSVETVKPFIYQIYGGIQMSEFSGALIYALLNDYSNQNSLEFATAASCLKHSIHGDFNQVTVDEVLSLMKGNSNGRIQR